MGIKKTDRQNLVEDILQSRSQQAKKTLKSLGAPRRALLEELEVSLISFLETNFSAKILNDFRKIDSKSLRCFLITNENQSAYFFLNEEVQNSLDFEKTCFKIRENLSSTLSKFYPHITISSPHDLSLPDFPLDLWFKEKGKFSLFFKTPAGGVFHGALLFNKESPFIGMPINDYVEINLGDLPKKSFLNFEVFLFLPKNNRFVCIRKPDEGFTTERLNDWAERKKGVRLFVRDSLRETVRTLYYLRILQKDAEKYQKSLKP